MIITLVRHGETEENKKGILQGHIQGNLSEEGILQARKLAERLKDEKFDVIFSSDLKRAFDTAKEIAKFHKGIIFETREELRELDLGRFTGKTKKEMGIPKEKLISDFIKEGEEGETTENFFKRAGRFVEFLKENYKDKNILLVGHNGINKAIMGNFLGYSFENFNEIEKLKSASISVIEFNKGKTQIKLINCTEHLNGNN